MSAAYAMEAAVPVEKAQLRRGFWAVMITFLVHGLVVSTWVARIVSIKSALRLSDGALGLALLGAAIGSIAATPVCGWLVTRYGSRQTTKWTSVGFCLALVLPALAYDGPSLFVALLLFGMMAGANDVSMNVHAVGVEKLLGTPTMSRFHAMFSLAGLIGAGLGGLVASRAITPLAHMAAAAVIFLAIVGLNAQLAVETSNGISHASAAKPRRLPMALVALSAIGFCIFLSEGAIADWTGVYLKQVLGASEGLAPMGYAAFSAAMFVFRFAGDAIVVRLGRAWTIRLGGMIAAAGLAFAVSVHSPYWALAGFAAAGAGFSSIIPLVFAAGGRIPSVGEGAGVATVTGLGYLGYLVGPPVIGFVSQMTSLRMGLFLLVILSAGAAMLVTAVERGAGRGFNPLKD